MIGLTREQVKEIDRRAVEEYHIPGIVLMENAARAVAEHANLLLRGVARPSVLIVCGGGNNGGDGFAVARHLHNAGVTLGIVAAVPAERYAGDALANLRVAQAMRLPIVHAASVHVVAHWPPFSIVIDALFGTGLTSAPRDAQWIEFMNTQAAPVLAVDLPSGMDCDTGEPLGACVRARETVTFVAPKRGFENPASRAFTGTVWVGDIGCPRELIEEVANMNRP